MSSLEVTRCAEMADDFLSLSLEASTRTWAVVPGASVLARAARMDVPLWLLASNFRKLGFLRPKPCFENMLFFFERFYSKTFYFEKYMFFGESLK